MSLARWWSDRPPWQKTLVLSVPGLGIGFAVGYAIDRARRLEPSGFTPYEELPDVLDYESEEPSEPEPPGIVYDPYDTPCVVQPDPGEPVALQPGLEGDVEFCTPPADLEPKPQTQVSFAEGAERPRWPVDTTAERKLQVSYQDVRDLWHGRWGRHFGAPRKSRGGGKRRHAGIDLFADPGDVVVASEPGEILATLPFYKGTGALYLLTDSGLVLNYGEIEPTSWYEFGIPSGIGTGTRVAAGDKIARVGVSNDGSHMLHIEAYDPSVSIDQIRQGEMRWSAGDPAPDGLFDPTRYLVRAREVQHERMLEEA